MPTIQNQTDAVTKITVAGICGTDLHTYDGFYGSEDVPWGIGHEAVGYVAKIGAAVEGFQVGDYVIIPDALSDGLANRHLTPQAKIAYGLGTDFGYATGNQGTLLYTIYTRVPPLTIFSAEFVRVPHADISINGTNSTLNSEIDYLLASDIFSTAWTGLTFAGFNPGDTVAIFGAGPVGQLAAYSAFLRGASKFTL